MKTGKIIKVTDTTVYIGYKDGNSKEIPIKNFDFEPNIGDYVEVYDDIVIKVERNIIKKLVDEKSVVVKTNILVSIVIATIFFIIVFKGTNSGLFLSILCSVVLTSLIMMILNIIFIIISFIKKNEVEKKYSTICCVISVIMMIFAIVIYRPSSNKTTSQDTSSSTTLSSSKDDTSSSTTSSSSKESSKTEITVDNDKANYSEVDYNSWNHDEVAVDTKVKVYGKVLQAMEDGKSYTLRVAINDDYSNIILVYIPSQYNNRVIAEDDHITLYGLAKGRQSYETVFRSTKTLPYMVAYMYDN